jgi:predicted negative regulator of RcsB-dependent stress response
MKEISGNTKVALSLASIVALVGAIATAAWQANSVLTQIRDSVMQVSTRIDTLETNTSEKLRALEVVMQDRFTKTAAAEWALRIKVANPDLAVPDPREPATLIGRP